MNTTTLLERAFWLPLLAVLVLIGVSLTIAQWVGEDTGDGPEVYVLEPNTVVTGYPCWNGGQAYAPGDELDAGDGSPVMTCEYSGGDRAVWTYTARVATHNRGNDDETS